jgi:hypothetical protein
MYSGSVDVSDKTTWVVNHIMRQLRGQGYEPFIEAWGNEVNVRY